MTLFLDGKRFADATMVIALGITSDGEKRFLGFVETDTENAKVLTLFLRSLVERGLDASQGLLVVLDGGKGLRAAVKKVFRDKALVGRCQWHKRENVVSHLARNEQAEWRRRLQRAYSRPTYAEALAALEDTPCRTGRDESVGRSQPGRGPGRDPDLAPARHLSACWDFPSRRPTVWSPSTLWSRSAAPRSTTGRTRVNGNVGWRPRLSTSNRGFAGSGDTAIIPKLREALRRELNIDKKTPQEKAA